MMHPTSGAHPSHRWFHTDEGEWRCACGADPGAMPDSHRHHMVSMPCVQHCAVDIENNNLFSHAENQIAHAFQMSGAMLSQIGEATLGVLDDSVVTLPHRTEYERCRWAGVEYLESDYQHMSDEQYDSILATVPVNYFISREYNIKYNITAKDIRDTYYDAEDVRESERWVMGNVAHAGVGGKRRALAHPAVILSPIRKLYHQNGGIVRHGCEARQ